MKKYSIKVFILIALVLGGCRKEAIRGISRYSGDGKIKYLPSPGNVGPGGVRITFPEFNLSKDYHVKYSFKCLPTGGTYYIIFVAPDSTQLPGIENSCLQIKFELNAQLIRDINLPIGKMVKSGTLSSGLRRYYCQGNFQGPGLTSGLYVKENSTYSIELIYKNTSVTQKALGHLLIERGEFK
jgi:hypothetical protein